MEQTNRGKRCYGIYPGLLEERIISADVGADGTTAE